MKLSRLVAAIRHEIELAEDLGDATSHAFVDAANVFRKERKLPDLRTLAVASFDIELPFVLAEPGLIADWRREQAERKRARSWRRRSIEWFGRLLRSAGERLAGRDLDELPADVPDVELKLVSDKNAGPTAGMIRLRLARGLQRGRSLELADVREMKSAPVDSETR